MSEKPESIADILRWGYELAPISNVPGHDVGIQILERPPGGFTTAHFHPDGHEWVYCIDGSMMLTIGDRPPKELKAGDLEYLPPNVVHFGRNVSKDRVAKLILFRVKPHDQPLTTHT